MNYIYRIPKHFLLFFTIILILFYSIWYHTDRIFTYFLLDELLIYVNSSDYVDNLDINSIEGNLASYLLVKDLSFNNNDVYVDVKEFLIKPNISTFLLTLKDYFLSEIDNFKLLKEITHNINYISIDDKKNNSFLAIPRMKVSNDNIKLDTLFVSYYDYVFFMYDINSNIISSNSESYHLDIANLDADSLEAFFDNNEIKVRNISYEKSHDNIRFSELVGSFTSNEYLR